MAALRGSRLISHLPGLFTRIGCYLAFRSSLAGGVVAVVGVPDDRQAVADQPERHGAFHGQAGAVAGLADPGVLAGLAEADLDGLITTGKFCCTRWGRLRLDWSRRPMWVRPSAGQAVVVAGAQDGADLDCPPPDQPPPRRRPPLGP